MHLLNPTQVTHVIYVGLAFPKYEIEKWDVTRVFKPGSLHADNVFKVSSYAVVSVKAPILPLKHRDYVCIFLERVCIASIPWALRGQVHSHRQFQLNKPLIFILWFQRLFWRYRHYLFKRHFTWEAFQVQNAQTEFILFPQGNPQFFFSIFNRWHHPLI